MSWYYVVEGQQAGPIEEAVLREMAGGGQLAPSTLVWTAGMPEWAPYSSVFQPMAQPAELVQCGNCGRQVWTGYTIQLGGMPVCADCKSTVLQRLREGDRTFTPRRHFAGFWIRFVARLIDGAITSVIGYVLQIPLLFAIGSMDVGRGQVSAGWILGLGGIATVLSLAAAAAFEGWFLVHKSATPGKLILGLKIIRADGKPITWGLAIGRYFAQLISAMTLYIGYLMVVWDEEKRSLHDRICNTRVVTGS